MRKIIALTLITSFAITGAAIAKGQSGQGGNGGQDGNGAGDNGPAPAVIEILDDDNVIVRRRPTYPKPRRVVPQHCHIGGEIAASDNECGHYSR